MGALEKISGNKKFRRFNLVNFYFGANFAKLKRRKNLSASGVSSRSKFDVTNHSL